MGREIDDTLNGASPSSSFLMEELEKRPGVLMVGASNVGKRTLLSRLLAVDFEEASQPSEEILCYGWTINTKYYTADISVWMAHIVDEYSIGKLPISSNLSALVLVFDMNEPSSFSPLQNFVSQTNIQKFDILLCIGNKVDLLPGHPAHAEYRRLLQRHAESSSDLHLESFDYGISESDGCSLLGDEEPSWDMRRSCLEWCIQHNIEYIEACASNANFDKCLSIDGDSQGVERLYGALSAHMWPGMTLKSGDTISQPFPTKTDLLDSSEEDSDYELEYQVLSADPFDDTEEWDSADIASTSSTETKRHVNENDIGVIVEEAKVEVDGEDNVEEVVGFDDIEQLMNEIGNVRGSLRLMPDFQRREMAGKLALRMAAMFGDAPSADEEGFDSGQD